MCQLADDQPPWFESYPLSWVLRFEVNLVSMSVSDQTDQQSSLL